MNTIRNPGNKLISADIAIIGGGGAGLSAAIEAAERGMQVVLLEKRRSLGGNSALAQYILAVNSHIQKQSNISITVDEALNTALEYAHWKINPRIVHTFLKKSADTLLWLEEKGLKFVRVAESHGGSLRTEHCMDSIRGGYDIIKALTKRCEEVGVKIYLNTPAKQILTDKDGNTTGVFAKSNDEDIHIHSKCVIITTGGYAGNKKLLRKYYPSYHENMRNRGIPNMGDGLLMAMKIGAATEGLGNILLHPPFYLGPMEVGEIAHASYSIWVNKKGERFTNEMVRRHTIECGNVVDRQPGKCMYSIFDESIKKKVVKQVTDRGIGKPGSRMVMDFSDFDNKLQSEVHKGGVKIADSLDEIAAWIGITTDTLKNTVDEYNACCSCKCDEVFLKDSEYLQAICHPPYYAVKCYVSYMTTIGGIKINHHMEVIDKQDDPIAGLYAGGDTTGGWESETYCMLLPASALGFAINSGRIAGENAANYVKTKQN